MTNSTNSPKDVVSALWTALAARGWGAVGDVLAEDCIYYDAPIGPSAAARGPRDVLARLRLALESLAEYTN